MGRGGKVSLKVSRYGHSTSSGQIGAGTFYHLPGGVADLPPAVAAGLVTNDMTFKRKEILVVKDSDIHNPGLPSEALAHRWFPHTNWDGIARRLKLENDGAAMDLWVAREARRRGYRAIKYGRTELQVVG